MKRILLCLGLLAAPHDGVTQASPFPHDRHARLFATCEGCHGSPRDPRAPLYPPAASCTTCHDGTVAKRVEWTGPTPKAQGLLAYSHPRHAERADTSIAACGDCHAEAGAGTRFLQAARPPAATCFACHAHRAPSHYVSPNRCATCHVPLVRATALTVARIRSLPKPPTHEAPGFVSQHAPRGEEEATCATCHARESCARCHINARAVSSIAALASDARVASAVAELAPRYPEPTDHRADGFALRHGAAGAAGAARCANCHARASCRTCHIGDVGSARRMIDRLPDPRGGLQGVQLRLAAPAPPEAAPLPHAAPAAATRDTVVAVRVHPREYRTGHARDGRAATLGCEGCHTQGWCASCHQGEVGNRTRFHVTDYAARHATDGWARDADCAACHTTEVFCRSCHQASGLSPVGRRAGAYHNAGAAWLLQHGRAARQGLASCTSCHQQRDCMRCHSTLGWGVSPHGPGFDAERLGKKAAPMCLRCHVTKPVP